MEASIELNFDRLATELNLSSPQVRNVSELIDSGNTVPFITRYRKEQTGNLNEDVIHVIQERLVAMRQLAERATSILRTIERQEKLTPELRQEILAAESLKRLEDLYLPFRPKRRSRAQMARERGLEPLANLIGQAQRRESPGSLTEVARDFIDRSNDVPDRDAALAGAGDILAERVSENPEVRQAVREIAWNTGRMTVAATRTGQEGDSEYSDYFDYSERLTQIPPHRCLAINRGERDGSLRVRIEWDKDRVIRKISTLMISEDHAYPRFMRECIQDAHHRLIQPSIEREIRRELSERAERHAVGVFASNLKALLLQPPIQGQRVMAIDPGFRTGCKVAILDGFGNCLHHDLVFVTGNQDKRTGNREKLHALAVQYQTALIAIGNGTACRETEELISELISESDIDLKYVIVNEAGASIYSTSPLAREEFPDVDATVRGTISIGRRLQDPLSELVKIDPQHLGVGMYQHDVPPKMLKESLDRTIESCVNFVGVDLNTASAALLAHVSGFTAAIAKRVVAWRDDNGPFQSRSELRQVAGIGDATFTQAAGFLKIASGQEPLDRTWIHPESYPAARQLLGRFQTTPESLFVNKQPELWQQRIQSCDRRALATALGIGEPTLADIVTALDKPGRDPRTDLSDVVFKRGILKLDDLHIGMELTGTVLNVVDFGAFIDIGLKDSGLVHVSKMAQRFVRNPHEIVSVGDPVTVWVLGIDKDRRRVSLSMVDPATADASEV